MGPSIEHLYDRYALILNAAPEENPSEGRTIRVQASTLPLADYHLLLERMEVGELRLYLLTRHISRFYEELERAMDDMAAMIRNQPS